MGGGEILEPPQKRIKTDGDNAASDEAVLPAKSTGADNAQTLKEIEVGITEFVSPENEGFLGILKKR